MKVLFIAYFHDPFPGVGAKRLSYWSQNISKFGIEPEVITAIEQTVEQKHITYVEDTGETGWLGKFIKDPGLSWKKNLLTYFKSIDELKVDVIVISGGPFMHFSLATFLRRKYGVKIILDFRDPFAINPGFKNQSIKVKIKKYFERKFIKSADKVITVNDYCKQLLSGNKREIVVIENGYNELDVPHELPVGSIDSKFRIGHAGTFISGNRNPNLFLEAINDDLSETVEFYQFGKDSEYFDSFRERSFFHYESLLPYSEMINRLRKMDACMLVTEGKSFESTTKIFDYIGLNQKILLITNGELNSGNLQEITKNYPNILWVKNTKENIIGGIEELRQMQVVSFDPEPFSRHNSLILLVKELKKLTDKK